VSPEPDRCHDNSFSRRRRSGAYFTLTSLRLVAGIVFFAHGAQLGLGRLRLFGYHGILHAAASHTAADGVSRNCSAIAGRSRVKSSACLPGSLRLASASPCPRRLSSAIFRTACFMNWYGSQKGEGFEDHLRRQCRNASPTWRRCLSLDRLIASRATGVDEVGRAVPHEIGRHPIFGRGADRRSTC
jgi:hypothetical protein